MCILEIIRYGIYARQPGFMENAKDQAILITFLKRKQVNASF